MSVNDHPELRFGLPSRIAASLTSDRQERRNLGRSAESLGYSVRVPVHLVDHPLVHDALVALRGCATTPEQFRQAARRISLLLLAEALRDLPTTAVKVQTPLYPPAA